MGSMFSNDGVADSSLYRSEEFARRASGFPHEQHVQQIVQGTSTIFLDFGVRL
jgi:hypothetical protein